MLYKEESLVQFSLYLISLTKFIGIRLPGGSIKYISIEKCPALKKKKKSWISIIPRFKIHILVCFSQTSSQFQFIKMKLAN